MHVINQRRQSIMPGHLLLIISIQCCALWRAKYPTTSLAGIFTPHVKPQTRGITIVFQDLINDMLFFFFSPDC